MKNDCKEIALPLAYFITFTCYGTWLHGGKITSVDPKHNQVGSPSLSLNQQREKSARSRMRFQPYLLDAAQRNIVLKVIKEVCVYREWVLLAAHVRTNHVHLVIHALTSPENILNAIKAYSSRALNCSGIEVSGIRRWTRHGSTRYLWKAEEVETTIQYVVHEQGIPMAVFENVSRSLEPVTI